MDYKNKIAEIIKIYVELDIDTIEDLIETPPKLEMGDYTLPCFKLSKVMRKAPNVIAKELKNVIYDHGLEKITNLGEYFEKVENIDAYLNFFINNRIFAEKTIKRVLEEGDNYGASNVGKGKTICIEYSTPNIAKPFHVGNLFSTVIGNALCKMFKKEGYSTIGLNYFSSEEFYNHKMDAVAAELKEKGLLVESNGAQVVSLKDYNMPPYIISKDGESAKYTNRDLAAAIYRKKIYDFYKCVYIAGNSKALHFKQAFKVLELEGYEWAGNCVHAGFGLVKFADRKLFNGNGYIVLLNDLFCEAAEKTMEVIKDKDEIENKEEASQKIGTGSVIFAYLKNLREKDVVFDWKEMVEFDEETNLYVQCTYARGRSVLIRAGECDGTAYYSKLSSKEEFELVKSLADFNNVITLTLDKLEPSILTRYVIETAKKFNKFCYAHYLLELKDKDLEAGKLRLIKASLQVMKNALELLGISVI